MAGFLELVCLTEVDKDQHSFVFIIDNDITPGEDSLGVILLVIGTNIGFSE